MQEALQICITIIMIMEGVQICIMKLITGGNSITININLMQEAREYTFVSLEELIVKGM